MNRDEYQEAFNLTADLVNCDAGWLELHGYAHPSELADDSHDDEYYCGICGWSHISTFPHNH